MEELKKNRPSLFADDKESDSENNDDDEEESDSSDDAPINPETVPVDRLNVKTRAVRNKELAVRELKKMHE